MFAGIAIVLIGYLWFYKHLGWDIAADVCVVLGGLYAGLQADSFVKLLFLGSDHRNRSDTESDSSEA